MGDGFFGFGPLGCGGAGMSSGPIGAPGSSKQRGQNHSPSGMASSAGIKHPKWYGESHCMRGKREGPGTEEGRDKWEKKTDLITLQRRIVISIILGTNDAVLRGIEIRRMSRQIGELVVWPGEEESRVLTGSDPGYPVGRNVFNPASTKQLQLHCGEFQHATPIPWTPITDRAKHRRTNKEKIVVTLVKHQRNERRTVIPHSKLRTGECIEKKRETWTHSYTSMPING